MAELSQTDELPDVGAWARVMVGQVDDISGFDFDIHGEAWGGGRRDAGDAQDEGAATISDHVVGAVEKLGLHLGGAACGHGDSAHPALTHEFEDVGLGEVTAEGFAGSPDGYRGLDLRFAFAGGEQLTAASAPRAGVLISMPSPSHVRGRTTHQT